ncbi:MAG TPA: glycosyl hydrolase family 18 protein [Aliidongia sp.]|uniref:glycoside hydrolase family 18 protein n=1 Tax=Aliidongia sp. TaxID=1914230 RepID=UPI002DDC92CD|nr:glycosyl hydrolase family 18 protein [Aliidongia sp.]HEV2675840.1 glycosyl hydrolase family 18 protein [Aliidongia sp.]
MSRILNLGFAAIGLCCATASGSAQTNPLFAGRPQPFAQTSGKVVGFYLDGDSVADGYRLDPVTARNLTHLLYAFLTICGPGQGEDLAKACASKQGFELAVAGKLDDAALTRYLAEVKAMAPKVKILVSIGGAMGSKPFFALTRAAADQARFVQSTVDFLAAHPMVDGIDIDWEFPTDSSPQAGEAQLGIPADGRAYADLLHALRTALDTLGAGRRHYLLTSAVLTSARLTRAIDYRDAQRDADLFFAMTYDYYGPWGTVAGHHTPVVAPRDEALGPVGIAPLLDAGIPPAKLVRGIAAYGRGWQVGPTGQLIADYNGSDGSTVYRDLAKRSIGPAGKGIGGFEVTYDAVLHAYALWNPETRVYVGYDDPRAVREKARAAVKDGLAGVFAWELSGDDGDLLGAMNRGVGNRPKP